MKTTTVISFLCDSCNIPIEDEVVYGFIWDKEEYFICQHCFEKFLDRVFEYAMGYKADKYFLNTMPQNIDGLENIHFCSFVPIKKIGNEKNALGISINRSIIDLTNLTVEVELEEIFLKYFFTAHGGLRSVKASFDQKLKEINTRDQKATQAATCSTGYKVYN